MAKRTMVTIFVAGVATGGLFSWLIRGPFEPIALAIGIIAWMWVIAVTVPRFILNTRSFARWFRGATGLSMIVGMLFVIVFGEGAWVNVVAIIAHAMVVVAGLVLTIWALLSERVARRTGW